MCSMNVIHESQTTQIPYEIHEQLFITRRPIHLTWGFLLPDVAKWCNTLGSGWNIYGDLNWAIPVPADGLAPDGARPSAGTKMSV